MMIMTEAVHRHLPFSMILAVLVLLPVPASGIDLSPALPHAATYPSPPQSALGSALEKDELVVRARRTESRIVIDGRIHEADWSGTPVARGFIRQNIHPGTPAPEDTEVRVLYDDRNLYVAMRMIDSNPDSIAAQLGRRDTGDLYTDWAEVFIDSYRDRRSAFLFALSPGGVQRDGRISEEVQTDLGWDAVWEGAARTDSLGWSAEFRIPLSQLRFRVDDDGSTVWGINFGRTVARRGEISHWAHVPPNEARFASAFGRLEGLEGIPFPRSVELTPYVLARSLHSPAPEPDRAHSDQDIDAGLDLRYGLGSSFTLNATLNPEFGQVGADPAVLNLTAFETFFPERRPFFVESADLFRRDAGALFNPAETVFYSRRIGRPPQGSIPPGSVVLDQPSATRIRAASKLSGKSADGWSLGVLHAATAEEYASTLTPEGAPARVQVEPGTHFSVARVTREFSGGQSAIGGIATLTRRNLTDAMRSLPEEAFTAGIDARHRWGEGAYELEGWILRTHVLGDTSAIARLQRSPVRYFQRPDADHVEFSPDRTSLEGASTSIGFQKIAGGPWRTGLVALAHSPEFELNDLGFLQAADQVRLATWVGYMQAESGSHFRSWSVFTNHRFGWSWGGERRPGSSDLNSLFQLNNRWEGYVRLAYEPSGLVTESLRGGPALRRPARVAGFGNLRTDPRNTISFDFAALGEQERGADGSAVSARVGTTIRPSPRLSGSLTATWRSDVDEQLHVRTEDVAGAPEYILATARQNTLAMAGRVNVTFTPTLTLEVFMQPFLAAVEYDQYKRPSSPRAHRASERLHRLSEEELAPVGETEGRRLWGYFPDGGQEPAFTFPDPGFKRQNLRGNAVLRWEYRPGSTLFVVWQQDREGRGLPDDLRVLDDFRQLARSDARHVLLIKVNYWLGL